MVHCIAMQMGYWQNVYFGNSMSEVYVKCGSISDASKLFDEMINGYLVLSHFNSLSFFFSFLCFESETQLTRFYFFYRQFYNLGFIIINLIIII